jgi:hypothetical protein
VCAVKAVLACPSIFESTSQAGRAETDPVGVPTGADEAYLNPQDDRDSLGIDDWRSARRSKRSPGSGSSSDVRGVPAVTI